MSAPLRRAPVARLAPRAHLLALAGLVAVVTLARGASAAFVASARGASVELKVHASGDLAIVGTTSELRTSDAEGHFRVIVPLAKLTTGISLRDAHMRDKYLEVQKYPEATLDVARADLRVPQPGGGTSATLKGTLTLHGVSKPVDVKYAVRADGAVYHVDGELHIDMREFGIIVPAYFGVTVKPATDIAVKFDATGS